jgi:hypothetical protein
MVTLLPDDHFTTGVFAHPHPGELFNRFTCNECGGHSITWEAFKRHRARTCLGHQMMRPGDLVMDGGMDGGEDAPAYDPRPAYEMTDAERLAELLQMMDDEAAAKKRKAA